MEIRGVESGETTPNHWKTAAMVMTFLFVGAVVTLGFLKADFNKHSKLTSENLEAVQSEKLGLENQLTGLVQEYELQISDNETLKDSLTEQLAEVEHLETKVRQAEGQLKESKASTAKIKAQLKELEEVKTNLEAAIASLTDQNESLETANSALKEVLAQAEEDIAQLHEEAVYLSASNEQLMSRLSQIAPAGFTADNFVVTAHRKNAKLTNKASRAEVINIAFDIDNVPSNYDTDHEIYVVLTDLKGMPVKEVSTVDAVVKTGDADWPVQAALVETLTVDGNQLVEMSIKPGDDLDPGQYNLIVYADNGFLGATGFQLR